MAYKKVFCHSPQLVARLDTLGRNTAIVRLCHTAHMPFVSGESPPAVPTPLPARSHDAEVDYGEYGA